MRLNRDLERFSRDVAADKSLRKEIVARGTNLTAIVALANAKGYAITLDDVQDRELSDEDLEAVAGGAEPALANYIPSKEWRDHPERIRPIER